jgi:hypothetical protein
MNQVTIGEAYEALNASIAEYVNDGVITTEAIATFDVAIQNDVNFRDLLMGLPKHYEMDKCVGFISYVLNFVDGKNKAPYLAIMSAYAYELGNAKEANLYAQGALTLWEDYSLAQLLRRMYISGMPSNTLASMRNELDSKVRDRVKAESSEIVEIANA